nr:nuclear body protein SP140-like protein isoform X1 [Zootoca vivipara]
MSAPGTSAQTLDLFKAHKVEISAAISKLFPFLHGLRDKKIISEEDFKNWEDKGKANPNDIQEVVYDVLESIQSNLPAIKEIFCSSNLKAYEDLKPLYEILGNGTQQQNLDSQDRTLRVTCGTAGVPQRKNEDGKLPEPARAPLEKNKPEECIVCKKEDSLIHCSSCPRCFHDDCHIPKISAKKRNTGKWKCTFCQHEDLARDRPRNKDQVLKLNMRGKRIVKCDLLLLWIWCKPKSCHFVDNPATIQNYNAIVKRPMWLKRIAGKLHKRKEKYDTVGAFKKDMHLMFNNFQKFYKDNNDRVKDGKELKFEFEKKFREVFSIL